MISGTMVRQVGVTGGVFALCFGVVAFVLPVFGLMLELAIGAVGRNLIGLPWHMLWLNGLSPINTGKFVPPDQVWLIPVAVWLVTWLGFSWFCRRLTAVPLVTAALLTIFLVILALDVTLAGIGYMVHIDVL